ncbi:MAG: hypothetical protein JO297_01690 [Nitrososphaeraceae archaeon]|nr:hypothetical protein [Nitrososphaeraceae archaeon]
MLKECQEEDVRQKIIYLAVWVERTSRRNTQDNIKQVLILLQRQQHRE